LLSNQKSITPLITRLGDLMTVQNLTIDQITEIAGVSSTTVSRVLNNRPDVNHAIRRRVLARIEEHNHQPNVFARAKVGSGEWRVVSGEWQAVIGKW